MIENWKRHCGQSAIFNALAQEGSKGDPASRDRKMKSS
jgi:hypothetical protein